MTPEAYEAFTRALVGNLESEPRVVGLVALGSMAARDYLPDRWSDHDFFVIVEAGEQERFRTDLSWLPEPQRIVLAFRETEHGMKVVYDDGHLLEFAVFDVEELHLAQVNRYRVLLDRGGIADHLRKIEEATTQREGPSDEYLLAQFFTTLLVGIGRYQRGERLSGGYFIKTLALRHLLVLLAEYAPAEEAALLDNLDPFRRVERALPELGAELDTILSQDALLAARGLIELAERELGNHEAEYPRDVAKIVLRQIEVG
jgi:hypothetical protein